MTIDTPEQRWTAYHTAFATIDKDERRRLLERSVSDDVVFTNPGGEGRSREALMTHIDAFQKAYPGAYFETEKLYPQKDKLLAIFAMHNQEGARVVAGYNFVRFDRDGRFEYMAGFF